jgi:CRISPR system Cascade subunit CasE
MSSSALNLLHTQPDPQRLTTWAARHRLLDAQGDLGYALHALLHAAFGEHAPQPFRYLDAEQGLLAYTSLNAAELTQCAALADIDVAAALGLGRTPHHAGFSVRPFPTLWAAGHELAFEVRVRPIIREGKTARERDAFLAAVERAGGSAIDRSEVYVQWLRELLARQGGAEVIDARVTRYQLLGVTRKTQVTGSDDGRRGHVVSGPDAVLMGRLRVADPRAFAHLLSHGVGRHRAFGFGLLLLHSAQS